MCTCLYVATCNIGKAALEDGVHVCVHRTYTITTNLFVYSRTWMFVFKSNYCAFAYGST